MNRILVVVVLIAALAATAFAAAASLNLIPDQLGAGAAPVTSCDTDGVGISWKTSTVYSGGNKGATVIGVRLTGVNEACEGQVALLGLYNAGSNIRFATAYVPSGGGDFDIDFPSSQTLMADQVQYATLVIKTNPVAYDGTIPGVY